VFYVNLESIQSVKALLLTIHAIANFASLVKQLSITCVHNVKLGLIVARARGLCANHAYKTIKPLKRAAASAMNVHMGNTTNFLQRKRRARCVTLGFS